MARCLRLPLLIGLASFVACSSGLSGSAGPSPFLIRYWQTPDGLLNNSPTSILQAPDGDLWIASNSGVSRFDGVLFENFTVQDGLPDNQVQCLFVDSRERIWLGTRRGVVVRENGSWKAPDGKWSLDSCSSITETPDGAMWFGTGSGLWRWKDGEVENLPDLTIRNLLAAPDNSVWIIGFNSITRLEDGEARSLPSLDRLLNGREVWGMVPTGDGQWVVFGQDLLVRGAGDHWENLTEGMPDGEAKHISCEAASDGSIWVATRNRGIACLKNGAWTRIDTNDGLSHDDVRFLLEDQEGNIWACTNGGGLNQVRHRRIEVFGMKEGLGRHVTTALITDAAGQLWAGTDGGGIKRLEGNAFVPAQEEKSSFISYIWALSDDGGKGLWVSAYQQGLSHWQNGESKTVNAQGKFENNWIHGMLRDRAGDLWIGTHKGGILRLHDDALTVERPSQGGIATPVIGFLEKQDGELWAYTSGSGILRRTGRKWLQPAGEQGLQNATVSAMHEDAEGRVWIGLPGRGLALWSGSSYSFWTTDEGLASNAVLQVIDDSLGNLWLGTNVGLQRISIKELLAVGAGVRKSLQRANLYSRDEGLSLPQFTVGHGNMTTRTPDGGLWFSMAAGAVRVPPGTNESPSPPLPLRIDSVTMDGRTLWHHEWPAEAALKLESPDEPVEFHFAAPSFTNPEKLRFRYRLVGLNDSWRDSEGRRMVTFSSLPPGDFQFEVNAARPGGPWEETTAAIKIRITPKFWQSWWFLGASIIFGSVAVALSARWWALRRVKRRMAVLEQERKLDGERSRIAQDLHDDLGATLTEINFLGVLGASQANSPATRDRLHGIVSRAQRMAKSLDEIVWTVNPANDSLSSTVNYLCSRAQESLASANLRCRLEVAEDFPAMVLNSDLRHHLLMAVNEAVNNVMKHASATEVRLVIRYQQGSLIVTISDNGCGFDPEAVEDGRNGLGNMRKRMESDGGSCEIQSQPGQTTKVILTLPLSDKPGKVALNSTRSGSSC